jgi:hypothetical protein
MARLRRDRYRRRCGSGRLAGVVDPVNDRQVFRALSRAMIVGFVILTWTAIVYALIQWML